jgi:hypothetical protein
LLIVVLWAAVWLLVWRAPPTQRTNNQQKNPKNNKSSNALPHNHRPLQQTTQKKYKKTNTKKQT